MGGRLACRIAIAAATVANAAPVFACNCLHDDVGLVAPASITLPTNAVGLLFEGPWTFGEVLANQRTMQSLFEIWRLDGEHKSEVEVEWRPLLEGRQWLIFPKGGFEAGGRYEVVSKAWKRKPPRRRDWSFEQDANTDSNWEQKVVVDVAEEAVDFNQPPQLVVGLARPVVWPVAAAAWCTEGVTGLLIPLYLLLPPSLAPFRDALQFSTEVDGKPWRPKTHLCTPPLPGSSWVGRGLDALLLECPSRRASAGPRSASILREGRHEVTMRAALPGTPLEFVASTTVDTFCPIFEGPPAPRFAPAPPLRHRYTWEANDRPWDESMDEWFEVPTLPPDRH